MPNFSRFVFASERLKEMSKRQKFLERCEVGKVYDLEIDTGLIAPTDYCYRDKYRLDEAEKVEIQIHLLFWEYYVQGKVLFWLYIDGRKIEWWCSPTVIVGLKHQPKRNEYKRTYIINGGYNASV